MQSRGELSASQDDEPTTVLRSISVITATVTADSEIISIA